MLPLRPNLIFADVPQRFPQPSRDAFYPNQRIDVSAINASVQRYIPSGSSSSPGHSTSPPSSSQHLSNNSPASTSYISLPPGIDPATVDFRTFYPYNPSEVKHRKRTTRNQLKLLEETFKKETKPNASLRKALAAELEMTPRGVQVRCFIFCSWIIPLTIGALGACVYRRSGFKTGTSHFSVSSHSRPSIPPSFLPPLLSPLNISLFCFIS